MILQDQHLHRQSITDVFKILGINADTLAAGALARKLETALKNF
jgi:hypothetical protein